MTESSELERAAQEGRAATSDGAHTPTSIRAVEGFFAAKAPVAGDESLFKRFLLVPASWDAFQRKFAQLEKPSQEEEQQEGEVAAAAHLSQGA